MKNYQTSRSIWTEQYKILSCVTHLVKKLREEPLNNNGQNSRPLIGMSEPSATIVMARPAGPGRAAYTSGCQKSGTWTCAAPGWARAG